MKNKLFTMLVLGSAVFSSGCAAHRLPNYVFSVTGIVAAEDGSPIEGAEITLELNGPLYEVALPVKTVGRLTNEAGSFAFTYTTHAQGIPYAITVSKHGFETQTVSSSAPPAAYHAIRLRKTTSGNADKSSRLFPRWQERQERSTRRNGNPLRPLQTRNADLSFGE